MAGWETEPSRVEFEASGFPCLIRRHPSMGFLCGYIGVPESMAARSYDDFAPAVHGGWTYMADNAPGEKPDGRVWYGFDCGHAGDLIPTMRLPAFMDDVYRNVAFVRAELERVAAELAPKETSND